MRKFFQIFWAALVAIVVFPVLGGFFAELAKDRGWYEHPSARVEAAMNWLLSVASHPVYLISASLFAGLALGMWLDSSLRRRENEQKSPLEILFSEGTPFVELKQGIHGFTGEFYSVGIKNAGKETINNVTLRALDGWFTREAIAFGKTGTSYTASRPVDIIVLSELHPNAPEYRQMFGLGYSQPSTDPEYIFNMPQQFVIEAFGKNTPAVRRTFEYDPKKRPMLRMKL